MKRLLLAALGLLAVLGQAGAAGFQEFHFGNVGGWVELHSWCDTPGRVLAVSAPDRAATSAAQPVKVVQWVNGIRRVQPYQLGPGDAGAGQVYTALTPAGQTVSQTPAFFIHSSNIENTLDPAYRLTHINEYRLPEGHFRCRYVPQAAVLAATTRHTVIVWENAGRITYASRNRDGTPGVYLTGGTHSSDAAGEHYTWTRGEYQYRVVVGRASQPGGFIRVQRGGTLLGQYPLLAYSLSLPR